MSFEDTNCPCGGKKERDTMLCPECVRAFADHSSMEAFADPELPLDARAHAARVLVILAKGRKRGGK